MVAVVGPLIDHVVGPAADQRGHGDDDQPVRDDVRSLSAFRREAVGQPGRGDDREDIGDAVPADLEGSVGEGDGIGREVDHGRSVYPAGPWASRAGPSPYTGRDDFLPGGRLVA